MRHYLLFMGVFFLAFLILMGSAIVSHAQEVTESISNAEEYLDSRTNALDKYLNRSGKIQQRLLRKLKRKEDKIARQLAAKDSTLYRLYLQQRLSYDSIARLSHDTNALNRFAAKKNKLVDSLKGVQDFIQKQTGKLGNATALSGKAGINTSYTDELNKLQQQLNTRQGIDEMIKQRTGNLEKLAGSQNISGLQSIQKNVYYAQEKIKAFKKLADDPDEAEEELFEKLQGMEDFDNYLKQGQSPAFGGLGNEATAEDLQKLGYQTKSQINSLLQQKLGNGLSTVQQQMAQQVQDYSEKLSSIAGKVSEAKQGINEARQTIAEARQVKDKLKHIEKPTFRKNPERGKPFWQRLEAGYNFQTTRSTTDRPAMLELGASVAFKHSPRLSYGIGLSLSTGLGQNWQNMRFTYEGIGTRAFADWKALYGFSLQVGYERSFRPQNRPYLPSNAGSNDPSNQPSSDNIFKETFGGQQQCAYIGIMKRYRINSKWNGTFMIGYNILWQQEGLRSPWVLRFGAGT